MIKYAFALPKNGIIQGLNIPKKAFMVVKNTLQLILWIHQINFQVKGSQDCKKSNCELGGYTTENDIFAKFVGLNLMHL